MVGLQRSTYLVAIVFIAGLFGLAATIGSPVGEAASPNQVEVCHVDGNGGYEFALVAQASLSGHLAHGDAVPGDPVPGTPGYVFDSTCNPIAADSDGDGINDPADNCPAVPNADQADRYGSPNGDACENDSNGDGVLDIDEPHMCVSIDGVDIVHNGIAWCSTRPGTAAGSNIAVAHGIRADARAVIGEDNVAIADGNGSVASTAFGDHNRATADGPFSRAISESGDNNTATAVGIKSRAAAAQGNNNAALATGDGSSAVAGSGNNNSATATTDFSSALAANGNDNTATSNAINGSAGAEYGDRNTATANGWCNVSAGGTASDYLSDITNVCP